MLAPFFVGEDRQGRQGRATVDATGKAFWSCDKCPFGEIHSEVEIQTTRAGSIAVCGSCGNVYRDLTCRLQDRRP
ncbi:hypothetical protein LCGC14_0424400 [marine sediment metagenome]|uniref:Uncharacterized protein n=1 Tax=marine sediment metagenome TaxID=412755 RepID=A0A0F9VZ32_9ZZZZ